MFSIDSNRCRGLGLFLGTFPEIMDIIDLIEDSDKQFIAIKRIVEQLPVTIVFNMVIANSLISYFLTGKGEDYWDEFTAYLLKMKNRLKNASCRDMLKIHREFLRISKYNKLSLRNKYSRLKKYYCSSICRKIIAEPFRYAENLSYLTKELEKITGSKSTSKTIVFASKMYWYVCKILGKNVKGDIDMPIDRRNAFITISSGMIMGCNDNIEECVSALISSKYSSLARRAWRIVGQYSGIPLYRLDALTWNMAPHIRYSRSPEEALSRFCEDFGDVCNKHRGLIKQIILELGRIIFEHIHIEK